MPVVEPVAAAQAAVVEPAAAPTVVCEPAAGQFVVVAAAPLAGMRQFFAVPQSLAVETAAAEADYFDRLPVG